MAERTHIPASQGCGQWEILLADALDGLLSCEERAADQAFFAAHMSTCPACTELFEEARRGREWLEFLSPEPEVPAGLLDRILAQTGPGQVAGYGLIAGDTLPLAPIPHWQRPGFMGFVRRFAEPRLMMTAAMAFFSIALTMNMTGVRLQDLRPGLVRSIMERRLTTASTPIIRYYDHLRVVYEVESGMKELRRATQSTGESGSGEQKTAPVAPGESKKSREGRPDPLQQPASPAETNEFLETSVQNRPAHSGGSVTALRERSTVWTA
jgi:hypothetical protein